MVGYRKSTYSQIPIYNQSVSTVNSNGFKQEWLASMSIGRRSIEGKCNSRDVGNGTRVDLSKLTRMEERNIA